MLRNNHVLKIHFYLIKNKTLKNFFKIKNITSQIKNIFNQSNKKDLTRNLN